MRIRVALTGAAAFLAAFAWQVAPASAHHPDVVAVNVCVDGVPSIAVTASAWITDLGAERRVNTNVRIDAWGPDTAVSASGVFAAPNYQADAVFAVPHAVGDTLLVRATAVAAWGPNQEFGFAGTWSDTTVTVADPCPPTDGIFGGEERPTTTVAAPPTTEAPEGVTPPPAQVLGAVASRTPGQIPAQVNAPRQLAFTGGHDLQLATFGLAALVGGSVMVAATNRRRDTRSA